MEAIKNGFTEGIALSVDGLLSEGSGENLFIVKSGKLYTPPTGLSVLPGITRDTILTLAEERGYEVEEKLIPREALYIADELFFTGTAAEVTPVRSVDHITVGEGRRGPITEELQTAYLDTVEGRSDHDEWLTVVTPKAEAAEAEEITA
jgi:branched-chain amino acid aminotransferase